MKYAPKGVNDYLADSLDAIVVTVDGRGTGFNGDNFMKTVKGRLGTFEVQDFSFAARYISETLQNVVNADSIAIQGWSYGGYLVCKAMEDVTSPFKIGVAVAPVTDWLLYDTIYTERYMGLFNEDKYRKSAVNSIKKAPMLIIHGTADDNVHVQHSMRIHKRQIQRNEYHVQFEFIPDDDHLMRKQPNSYLFTWNRVKDFLEKNKF